MKLVAALVLLLLSITSLSLAQAKNNPASLKNLSVEETIIANEKQLWELYKNKERERAGGVRQRRLIRHLRHGGSGL